MCVFDGSLFFARQPGQYLGSHSCLLTLWIEVVISPGHVACSHSHELGHSFTQTLALTCAHKQGASLEPSYTHTHTPRVAQEKGMPLSADVRTQVCVLALLGPVVSSSSPEASHLSVALFHFRTPPRGRQCLSCWWWKATSLSTLCSLCINTTSTNRLPCPAPKSCLWKTWLYFYFVLSNYALFFSLARFKFMCILGLKCGLC